MPTSDFPTLAERTETAVSQTALGNAIVDFLRAKGRLPNVQVGYLPGATRGEYSYPSALGSGLAELGPSGTVKFSYGYVPEKEADRVTATHEYAHAADRALLNQFSGRGKDFLFQPSTTQFTDAIEKLRLAPSTVPPAPGLREKDPAYADYRYSPDESLAFGAGNSASQKYWAKSAPAGGHLDATKATELAILLELAKRFPNPQKP